MLAIDNRLQWSRSSYIRKAFRGEHPFHPVITLGVESFLNNLSILSSLQHPSRKMADNPFDQGKMFEIVVCSEEKFALIQF